jgi:ribokinase
VVALSEGKSQKQAVIFANAASSITVTRNGAQTSIPGRKETDEVLEDWGY